MKYGTNFSKKLEHKQYQQRAESRQTSQPTQDPIYCPCVGSRTAKLLRKQERLQPPETSVHDLSLLYNLIEMYAFLLVKLQKISTVLVAS